MVNKFISIFQHQVLLTALEYKLKYTDIREM